MQSKTARQERWQQQGPPSSLPSSSLDPHQRVAVMRRVGVRAALTVERHHEARDRVRPRVQRKHLAVHRKPARYNDSQ